MKGLNDLIWNPEDNGITTNGMVHGCDMEISCDGPESYLNSSSEACLYPYFPHISTCNGLPDTGGEVERSNRCGALAVPLSCN